MNAIEFTPEEIKAFREELFSGFTDSQFNLAIAECKRRNLVPGQHVVFQLRSQKVWDPSVGAEVFTKKVVKVTTVDAFRLISQRTGEYVGQGRAKFYYLDDDGRPSSISDVPLADGRKAKLPWAASIPIYRKGFTEPVEVVCRFDAYAVTKKDGTPTEVWSRRGPEMLLKCSECAARRAAFPEELGGMYLAEEFQKEDSETAPPAEPTPVVEAPKATSVPEINHTPVQPTSEPRPNEKRTEPEPVVAAPKTQKLAKDTSLKEVVVDKVEAVQKMDEPAKSANDRCRDLIAKGVNNNALKAYLLSWSGAKETKAIPAQWIGPVLTKLEAMNKEDLIAEVAKLKPKEEF